MSDARAAGGGCRAGEKFFAVPVRSRESAFSPRLDRLPPPDAPSHPTPHSVSAHGMDARAHDAGPKGAIAAFHCFRLHPHDLAVVQFHSVTFHPAKRAQARRLRKGEATPASNICEAVDPGYFKAHSGSSNASSGASWHLTPNIPCSRAKAQSSPPLNPPTGSVAVE